MKLPKRKFNKIWIIVPVIILLCIFLMFFLKKDNKEEKMGNTITSQTKEEIEEYILNIDSYEAMLSIEVTSNKNQNKYKIKQSFQSPNICVQEVLEPSNIQGLKTIYDGTNLSLQNTRLHLSTVYENYPYLTENNLWLTSFVEEYKKTQDALCEDSNTQWILSIPKNAMEIQKKLAVDKKTGKPIHLEVQDRNRNTSVYIVYNEIEINNLKGKNILAFQQN